MPEGIVTLPHITNVGMTVNEFFEKIKFRRRNQWFFFGNDFLFQLYNAQFESEFNLNWNVNDLTEKYLVLIGRVLKAEHKGEIFTEADFLEVAKKKIGQYNQ
jgi:hypothetical protein